MGRKSRQKKMRRALRPVMQAAVMQARENARNEPRNWKIVPDTPEGLSQLNAEPEPAAETPSLLMPTPRAVRAVTESRS